MKQFDLSLERWLDISDHEARKHLQHASENTLHQDLVRAAEFIIHAKQFARAGDVESAQNRLTVGIGLALAAAAKHFPAPAVGLIGIARTATKMGATRN
jgi:hypothetical protein